MRRWTANLKGNWLEGELQERQMLLRNDILPEDEVSLQSVPSLSLVTQPQWIMRIKLTENWLNCAPDSGCWNRVKSWWLFGFPFWGLPHWILLLLVFIVSVIYHPLFTTSSLKGSCLMILTSSIGFGIYKAHCPALVLTPNTSCRYSISFTDLKNVHLPWKRLQFNYLIEPQHVMWKEVYISWAHNSMLIHIYEHICIHMYTCIHIHLCIWMLIPT